MSVATLVAVYVFGGLTFIPLLIAAILIPAWYLLPRGGHDDQSESPHKDSSAEKILGGPFSGDGAASGTFAVLRNHDFPAANAALNLRNNTGANGSGGTDGDSDATAGSESVYQSMYRSVFDRGKSVPASGPVWNESQSSGDASARGKTSANVFYIVLRHGHLMLYDSVAQLEVRHVISLARHAISLSEAGSPSDEQAEMRDGDLFIRRAAIVLTPLSSINGPSEAGVASQRPFFLFSSTCSEKEDFYHALLNAKNHPPTPTPIDTADAIKLQSALHSTSLTAETRALNALLGRIFLGVYHTDRVRDAIKRKIEKKISRVQKPAFIAALAVHSIDLGDAAPMLSNPRLKDLNISGDTIVAFDLRYDGGVKSSDGQQKRTGGIKITISATAKLDLGTRFKTRTVDLLLATSVQRVHGRMLVRIKPPPSNRIWFCFESMPEMDITVEPVVSSRQITYTFVLRAIEERIRSVVTETLVKPNWDDVPFFDTRGQMVRGGIWSDEGAEPDQEIAEDQSISLVSRKSKTMSMPLLPGESDTSSASSGTEGLSGLAATSAFLAKAGPNDLKRRSVPSLPLKPSATFTEGERTPPPRPVSLRSPSFTNPSASAASVAVVDANVEQVRTRDLTSPPPKMWRNRMPQLPPRKEAMDAMREMRDRSFNRSDKKSDMESDSIEGHRSDGIQQDVDGDNFGEDESAQSRDSDLSGPSTRPGSILAAGTLRAPTRTDTRLSNASSSSDGNATQQQRKAILTATAAATTAARNWSWNAIANARNAKAYGGTSHTRRSSGGPMGRGQPLPPPGTPLPGPQKGGLFGGIAVPSVKRRPVLPARPPTDASDHSGGTDAGTPEDLANRPPRNIQTTADSTVSPGHDNGEMEFGPWRENSGLDQNEGLSHGDFDLPDQHDDTGWDMAVGIMSGDRAATSPDIAAGPKQPKVPPPLPARRRRPNDTPSEERKLSSAVDVTETDSALPGPSQPAAASTSLIDAPPVSSFVVDQDDASRAQPIYDESEAAEVGLKPDQKFLDGEDVEEGDFDGRDHSVGGEANEENVITVPAPFEDDSSEPKLET